MCTSDCMQMCDPVRNETKMTRLRPQIGGKQPRGQPLPKGHEAVLGPRCQLLRDQGYTVEPPSFPVSVPWVRGSLVYEAARISALAELSGTAARGLEAMITRRASAIEQQIV